MPTEEQKDKVWAKAKVVRGRDPDLYRQDPYSNVIYKPSYGKDSEMGGWWTISNPLPRGARMRR